MANHSQQQNTNISLALFTPSECIAWLTIFGIETIAIVALNVLEIIIYMKERSLRNRSMYLMTNQAVADMLVGVNVINSWWSFGSACEFWAFPPFSTAFIVALGYFFPLASLLNLAAISVDRTHATFRPFKHRLVKKKIFGVVIAVVWIIAGLFTTSNVLTFFTELLAFEKWRDILLSYFSFFLFCLLIILISYSSIAVKILCGNQPHHHGVTNRERKLTKTLFIVTVASLLLTLPHVIFHIYLLVSLLEVRNISTETRFRLALSAEVLFFANSFVNPVIYTFRMPEFKRALFALVGCRSQLQHAQVFPLNEICA
ncbi:PREDICTED: neuropeptide FF receptor 2-like [Acropora digitifera]|uniref:neuropeptide FF receptor 2-like n=1 Tax=Acropora digitifera TaxID=70779 RepID=UPI00077AC01B|nr:PREDICTED: neuropeptide FF receptor 2-like [Acropora digitifera]